MTKTPETPVEQSAVDDAQAQADFDAGAAMESAGPKTPAPTEGQPPRDDAGRFAPAKPEAKADRSPPKAGRRNPEYVQLTKQQFERLEAAAKRTDDFEKQFSKAFGTIGDVQKIVRTLQARRHAALP
jgi:hypothetical protein